ncbi:MAG: hypothetical protein IPG07_14625 [Crocinitomicaceae bacterium]|nr:hypothetical protein [Crocinitomicaceae bacterium]
MNKKFILMPIFFLLMGIAMTAVVMLLWNWLMPTLFGLTIITFWQALGILILSKILFGGHGENADIAVTADMEVTMPGKKNSNQNGKICQMMIVKNGKKNFAE